MQGQELAGFDIPWLYYVGMVSFLVAGAFLNTWLEERRKNK